MLVTIKQIVGIWEGSKTLVLEEYERRTSLQHDLKNSISLLELKERLDKDSKHFRAETEGIFNELAGDIDKIGKQLQMLAPTYRGGIVGYFVAQFLFKPIHIGKMNWSMDLYAVARLLRTWSPESRTRVLWVGQKHLETILPVLEILNFSTLEDLVSKKPNDKCLRLK